MQYQREVECIECGAKKHEYKEVLYSREGVGEILELVKYPVKSGIKCCEEETLMYSNWNENRNTP